MTSVTVVVPLSIRRRGGRKRIIGPDGVPVQAGGDAAGVTTTRGDPALVKALARAFRWRRMLEQGRYGSIRELAAAEGVDRAYVGRLLNLTLLAPDIVEAIIAGRQPVEMKLPGLLKPFPGNLRGQSAMRPGQPQRRSLCPSGAMTGHAFVSPRAISTQRVFFDSILAGRALIRLAETSVSRRVLIRRGLETRTLWV